MNVSSRKNSIFLKTFKFSVCVSCASKHIHNRSYGASDSIWHSICILEAWRPPGVSQEKSKFNKKCQVCQCFFLIPNTPPRSLLGTRRYSMTPYLHHRTALIHSGRSPSIKIGEVQKVWKSANERNFFENGAHSQNLSRSHSQATQFSWNLRAHNPNRYISKPTWDGFRADLTTGERAILIFVKIFLEKTHSIFDKICQPIVL